MLNVSTVSNTDTARTNPIAARQRAERLAALGATNVLELCVGPSLKTLEYAYAQHGIKVTGNDIDFRWRYNYFEGDWLFGNALEVDCSGFDTVVFAPPLSAGCTGLRKDALQIDDVTPSYYDFLDGVQEHAGNIVLVLPARSLSTRIDRGQLHKLLSFIGKRWTLSPVGAPIVEVKCGPRHIRKYVELYLKLR